MVNTTEPGVHILYKKLGETPRECLERFRKELLVEEAILKTTLDKSRLSMTYAGRLDPMAEGVLIVLSGEKIVEKESFLNLPKQYKFEILWECSTDTADILGLPVMDDVSIFPTESDVKKEVEVSPSKFEQKYPAYSSQTVGGKALIEWAREGRLSEIELPSHQVEIFSSKFLSRRFSTGSELLSEITRRINLVTGDFRQDLTKDKWKKILGSHLDRQFAVDTVEIDVSGGFYVRQFVSDLAEKLKVSATTFHILRTKVGEYTYPQGVAKKIG